VCGIFGFIGEWGQLPDPDLLRVAAREASSRGPHAWGVVSLQGGALEWTKGRGPLGKALERELQLPESSLVLGHARLATTRYGAAQDLLQVQPLLDLDETVALAHNGTIKDPETIRYFHDLPPARTGNDSEVLLQLLAADLPLRPEALMKALYAVGGDVVAHAAVAISRDGAMVAASTGQPLYRVRRPEGSYICSRPLGYATRVETWAGRL